MNKNRAIWIISAFVILNFSFNNISFAADDVEKDNVYPDLSYEFTGKDTCEKFNRKLFVFNLKLNKFILRPINVVWASVMPKYGMDRFQCAYNNINYPIRLMGSLLQKDFRSSGLETVRFFTNTTIGFGGLYDPALTKFHIEPKQSDMEQVLAHYHVKLGPYLVLPVIEGNLRDLLGKLLNCPLRPTSYVGPFGAAANALFAVNNTTYMQPLFKKIDEGYADPYEIAKQSEGIARFIKNENLDRKEVLLEKSSSSESGIKEVSDTRENFNISPDISLENYNPQNPAIDSLRTAFFDNQKTDGSIWADVSIWNKCFGNRIKSSYVKIYPESAAYRYRYILQKEKDSPLAIIYPSIGDGVTSDKSVILAKTLYDEGYSVLIQGSPFHWEFIKSMQSKYKPGIPENDARLLRVTTSKIIENLQVKTGRIFDKKILVGCSFGAMTGLFVQAQEEKAEQEGEKIIGISKVIAINPPIDMFFALNKLDKFCRKWKEDSSDIKMRTAIAAEKVVLVSKFIENKDIKDMPESLPFNDDEAKLVIGLLMKQKLYDVVFAIENCTRCKKSGLCEKVNHMTFADYSQKYLSLLPERGSDFSEGASLYSISNFIKNSDKYRIYESMDDYFVNQSQLEWLKNISQNKSVLFANGSHLGCMYRTEFLNTFKKDTDPQTISWKDYKPTVSLNENRKTENNCSRSFANN